MAQYQVGKLWFFPEIGDKPAIGSVIELPEEAAARYMHNEPGLLKPVRVTAQAHPEVARSITTTPPRTLTGGTPRKGRARR